MRIHQKISIWALGYKTKKKTMWEQNHKTVIAKYCPGSCGKAYHKSPGELESADNMQHPPTWSLAPQPGVVSGGHDAEIPFFILHSWAESQINIFFQIGSLTSPWDLNGSFLQQPISAITCWYSVSTSAEDAANNLHALLGFAQQKRKE